MAKTNITVQTKRQGVVELDRLPPLITINTTATILDASPQFVRKLCREGGIRAVKVGGDWRVNTADLREQFGI